MNRNYSKENIYGLVSLHQQARNNGHLITCERIQAEIAKRPLNERTIAKKLNYYKPVQAGELFKKVA